jgi:signal transduction histidine kinase
MSSLPNLAEVLDKINDGICIWTPAAEIVFMNQKASEVLAASDDTFHRKIREALNDRSARRFEHHHDSLNRWFEHHAHPNADGGLTLVSRDISERKRAEKRVTTIEECGKLLASSLECDRTFPEMAEFMVSTVVDSCVILVRQDGQIVRMAACHSAPIASEVELQCALNRVIMTGKSEVTVSPVSTIVVPITARNETIGSMAVAIRCPNAFESEDIRLFEALGRRAALALENARLYREVKKADRLKDEFVAAVSHELRTPLTPIIGGVHMMRCEPRDSAAFDMALDLVERNARAEMKIVDDLLDLSRALSGKLRLNVGPVDLSKVIHGAVDTVRPASQAKNIAIDVQLGRIDDIILGDADRLQQVVWNLLANAVKFTPVNGRITIELSESPLYVELRVSDTGIGIEAEFLPYVFEKFHQENTSRTRTQNGLGLGLAIVRHLVESHGGVVQAYSAGREQGATFVVRLPLPSGARAAASTD